MPSISLSSVLLFALIVPPITKYWLWPGEMDYPLYGIIFSGILIYLLLDLKLKVISLKEKIYQLKLFTLLLLLILSLGSLMATSIITRHQRAPILNVHDIVVQVESATRYLIQGKNPYAENYFGTPLEEWEYRELGNKVTNPALYHFVMPPFYLLLHVPFYFASKIYPHYFDARVVLLFLLVVTIFLTIKLLGPGEERLLFIMFLALNPANLNYFVEGRSDFFVFAFLFLSWFLLTKKKIALSGVALALAFGSKQSAWPIIPLFLAYVFFEKKEEIVSVIKALLPGILTTLVIFAPFIAWNFRAFGESAFLYLSGGVANSYPVSGYGFGMLLYQFGIIKDIHAAYPFFIWQFAIGLPLLIFLIHGQRKKNTVQKLIFSYGLFLFVFWYFSRYFNNNHLAYLSMIFISAYFWPTDQKQGVKQRHFWPQSSSFVNKTSRGKSVPELFNSIELSGNQK
ncbi:MAG: glycosyltransferase 87 family protein [bacterium]|nr:glycosyltransferase 87 family protein [bacterium]